MEVSKLEGGLLAYWVGRAADLQVVPVSTGNGKFVCMTCTVDGDLVLVNRNHYRPHEDWAIGGPIIERERINIIKFDDCWGSEIYKADESWIDVSSSAIAQTGPTPLVSAMRAYVESKFGEKVQNIAD